MGVNSATDSSASTNLQLLGSVRKGNVFEATVEQLLRGIRIGLFSPGSRLPSERDLSEALGVSRATLREALTELQKAKYVEVSRGRYGGTIVVNELPTTADALEPMDAKYVDDVLIFREILEPAAAALAAKASLTAEQRSSLQAALEAVGSSQTSNYRSLDARLHILIGEFSGSAMLASAVADVRAATSELLDRIPFLDVNMVHSEEQHEGIVRAILSGNASLAETQMREHIDGTASLLRGFLKPA